MQHLHGLISLKNFCPYCHSVLVLQVRTATCPTWNRDSKSVPLIVIAVPARCGHLHFSSALVSRFFHLVSTGLVPLLAILVTKRNPHLSLILLLLCSPPHIINARIWLLLSPSNQLNQSYLNYNTTIPTFRYNLPILLHVNPFL